jgi:3-dehydroquinate synthase
MKTVRVSLKERSYNITIAAGLRHRLAARLRPYRKSGRMLVLTDDKIKRRHPRVFSALSGKDVYLYIIKHEKKCLEAKKTFKTVEKVIEYMLDHRFDRSSLIVALGGGVVGDIGGFAASIFMRGIPYIQVPTTLLAQVDSSVGGKTGVDSPQGKNMIGTFYQPKAVFIDPGFLKTLKPQEFMNGFAEVIKHGIIRSAGLFNTLDKRLPDIMAQKPALLEEIIAQNCRIKAAVVAADEREKKLRAILNFGHTYGHAVETLTGYRKYSHGQAVMLGMRAATVTAMALNLVKRAHGLRILDFLERAGMPARVNAAPEAVFRKMFSDKKTRGNTLNMIFPVRIGSVAIVRNPAKGAILRGICAITQ